MHLRRALPLVCSFGLLACQSGDDGSGDDTIVTTDDGATAATTRSTDGTGSTGQPTTTEADTDEPTGADTSATTSDTSGSSTGDEPVCGAGGVDDCCCFGVEGDAGHGVLSISCQAADSGCEAPQATCPADQVSCAPAELTVTSVEGLDCILAGLGAGTPGRYSWDITSEDGLSGSSHTLYVVADRGAFVSGYEYHELAYSYTAVDRRTLAEAAFFSDCAAAPTDGERFDCLRQATAGEAAETCLEGFEGTAGRR